MLCVLRISKPYAWCLVALAIAYYGYEFLLRLLPRLFYQDLVLTFHLSPMDIGLIASLYYYSYSVTQLVVGPALDKWGPKLTLTGATTLCALSLLIFVLYPSFTTFCLSRIFVGFASAFAFIGILKTADLYLPEKYNSFIAGLGTTVGMLCAQMGSSFITAYQSIIGWIDLTWILIYFALFLALLLLLFFPRGFSQVESSAGDQVTIFSFHLIKKHVFKKSILYLGLVGGFIMVVTQMLEEVYGSIFFKFLNLDLSHFEVSQILGYLYYGWIVAAPLWGATITSTTMRLQILRYSQLAVALMLLALISIALFSFIPVSPNLLRALFFILGIVSAPQVLVFALCSEQAPRQYRATSIAVCNCIVNAMAAIMPNLLGVVQQVAMTNTHYSLEAVYIASLSIMSFMLLFSAKCFSYRLSVLLLESR